LYVRVSVFPVAKSAAFRYPESGIESRNRARLRKTISIPWERQEVLMPFYILAHDLGTTGDKATLFSAEGKLVASAFAEYETLYPAAGWAEQRPDDYWRAFCASTKTIVGKTGVNPGDIAAVSFSGQMMAALPVDREGNALRNSIIWADLRSTKQAAEVGGRIGPDRVYAITGHRLSASYSATKIMWIREHEPEVYKKAFKFFHAKDFVACRLSGSFCTDYSDASGMNLLDIRALDWSEEMLGASGIAREKLPDLCESIQRVGKVSKEAAAESGLLAGTPVVKGGGDGASATCGAGVVGGSGAYIYLGTSTWMALATPAPIIDPAKRTFTFCHFVKGLYMPAGTMQAGGGSFKWFKDRLCGEESAEARKSGADVYDILTAKAEKTPPGSEGVLFLPYIMGERAPLWNPSARGCFIGLAVTHGKGHMLRAVLEGVAYNMKIIENAFSEQGVDCGLVRMIGGGAKSPFWRRIFADVMEKPTARLNFIEEATSVGAAIAGGVGAGLFPSIQEARRFVKVEETSEPDPNNFPAYRKGFGLFKKSYEQLLTVFDGLMGV
jgi:xylulokinase